MPLTINCWPSVSGGESYVNIEYESTAHFDLQNVVIAIPLPALSHAPRVTQVCSPLNPAERGYRRPAACVTPRRLGGQPPIPYTLNP